MSSATLGESDESTSLLRFVGDSTAPKRSSKGLRPTCELRVVKTRGAILVLMWNYFAIITFHLLSDNDGKIIDIHAETLIDRNKLTIVQILLGMGIFYPLAGWLADVHFGRYKTLRCSVWIMWIGIMLTTTMVIITKFHENTETVISKAIVLSYLTMAVGLSGFQANIVQFGVDQLIDASSEEIRAFLIWYVWTIGSSGTIYHLFLQCIPEENDSIFKMLYVAVSLTCAIAVDFLFNNYFIKEPVTSNPIKLVLKVIKYALKTKQPQRRSAFTYWEDKLPLRIDFGKSKYGGPFTNEQVEDVKTFLRMTLVLCVISIFTGAIIITTNVQTKMMYHFKDASLNFNSFQHCLTRHSISEDYSWVILVPLYGFIIHPLFRKCIPNVQIKTRFLIGLILLLITVSIQMTLEVVGHTIRTSNSNITVPCLLQAKEEHVTSKLTLDISYKWLIIPELTLGFALYTVVLAVGEFICAQSPYSMKGMMFGFIYFTNGVSTMVTVGIFSPFSKLKKIHWTWLGCGLWYYLLVLVITAVAIVLFVCIAKWYKTRERDDELPNIQTFAINYYERYAGRANTAKRQHMHLSRKIIT